MKTKIICGLILWAASVTAQTKPVFTDDLFPEKTTLLTRYLPADKNGLSSAAFQLKPVEFLARLNRFKKAAYQKAAAGKAGSHTAIYSVDIDAFALLLTDIYRSNYGIDSAREAYYYSLVGKEDSSAAAQQLITAAQRAMFAKKLSVADSLKLAQLANKPMLFNNVAVFKRSAFYRRLLDGRIRNTLYGPVYAKRLEAGENESLLKMTVVKGLTSNQFIRDYYTEDAIASLMSMTKDSLEVKKVYDVLVPEVKDAYYLADLKKTYKNFVTYSDGNTAPDFTYKDVNGKEVSLKDLRGKYVYIDLWATWCGPCKREIPYLTKVEEEFKDKNIHFVSISLDKVANYAQWKSYVISNNLKGIQLMVDRDFKSEFIESFNVAFIPRFILIDPAGKIKDGNAKRPSDPTFAGDLHSLLEASGK
jgi:thiol-disulfide isomerase/thioredoxin